MTIRLDSYYVHDALSGWYCGHVSREDLLEKAKAQAISLWGKSRPTLVIEPPPGETYGNRGCFAWLQGPARDKSHDGTHVVVVWFEKKDPADPLATAMALVASAGGWDKVSEGWEF